MSAHLGELKGVVKSLPNPNILLDTLLLQEALASSEIENIVTTHDDVFRACLHLEKSTVEAKEVARYHQALTRQCKHRFRDELPKIYSQDLINNLFRHPYTRVSYVANDLSVKEQIARKYLKLLAQHGIVKEEKIGRSHYYINVALANCLIRVADDGANAG